MSLINDALKKAQRQRGDVAESDPVPAARGRAPGRGGSSGGPSLMLGAGVGIVAVCAIIVTVVVLMRKGDTPAVAAPVAAPAQASAPSPAAPKAPDPGSQTPTAPSSPAVSPQPSSPDPITVAGVTEPAPPQVASQTQSSVAQTPDPRPQTPSSGSASGPIKVPDLTLGGSASSASQASSLPPQTSSLPSGIGGPAPEAGQNTAVLTWLSTLRVAGIRPAGADSKVLMNDRVYKLNDVVDYALGLKLTGIEIRQLTFIDEKGVSYVKEF